MKVKRHVTRRYSKKENPLYHKKVKSPIPRIAIALAGAAVAIYLVYLIAATYSGELGGANYGAVQNSYRRAADVMGNSECLFRL